MKTVYWFKNNEQFYTFLYIYTFDESLHKGAVKSQSSRTASEFQRRWRDSGW